MMDGRNVKKKPKIKAHNSSSIKYMSFPKQKINKLSDLIKNNKEIDIYSNYKTNKKESINLSRYKYYENRKNLNFNKIKNFFLIFVISIILLNIKGILCESYVIVKINKVGKYNFLFKGLEKFERNDENPCYGVSMQEPYKIIINEKSFDYPFGEYDFQSDKNTIELYYEDSKKNFECLFYGCSDIDEIDASHLDTSNAYSMEYMFFQCESLTSLNIKNLNTQKVQYMRGMFGFCSSLKSINVSHFITTSVEGIARMFEGCSNLTALNLSNFDTTKVKYMNRLFYGCISLTTLDISNFNTSNVIWMNDMFRECYLLSKLNLSHFDTSSVEKFFDMFNSCRSLISLNLSNFNTQKAVSIGGMFSGCNNLEHLDIHNFDTSKVEYMGWMFNECRKLSFINLSKFDTSSTANFEYMFFGCESLKSLNISNFQTHNALNMSNMFSKCSSLISLNLSNFVFSHVTDMRYMFDGCSNLKYINLKSLEIRDGIEYASLINDSLINPIICIEDIESLKKIISSYQCKKLIDPVNFDNYKEKFTNDDNIYINGCILSQNTTKCYQQCSFYFYYDEMKNKYICTEKLECPKPYDKLIYGKNECVKSCINSKEYKYFAFGNICFEKCPKYFTENKDTYNCTLRNLNGTMQKLAIIEIMKSGIMDDILSQVLSNNECYVIEDNQDLHIISALSGNLKRTDFSSINFGDYKQLNIIFHINYLKY